MAVNPALVKRFTEKMLIRALDRDGSALARYCPTNNISSLPEDCVKYGEGVCIHRTYDGKPLMVEISASWDSERYHVPIFDLAVSKHRAYK